MPRRYRMTPKRRAALRKAQLASARARRGAGRARSKYSQLSPRTRKAVKYAGVAAVALGTGAVVYKNRENLIIKHEAERRAVRDVRRHLKSQGKKMTKEKKREVKMTERKLHAQRSTFKYREYKAGRAVALDARKAHKAGYTKTSSIRPDRKGNIYQAYREQGVYYHPDEQRRTFEAYRKDVYTRAQARLNKSKGTKRRYGYSSGKRLLVTEGGQVKRAFW